MQKAVAAFFFALLCNKIVIIFTVSKSNCVISTVKTTTCWNFWTNLFCCLKVPLFTWREEIICSQGKAEKCVGRTSKKLTFDLDGSVKSEVLS